MLKAAKGGDLTPAVFTYGDAQQVRTLVIDDQPWFVAQDVCGVLGLSHIREAIRQLDDDEAMVSGILTPSRGRQQMQLVNESGLYNLIFRSRKPQARAFRRWVTSEVLPSIRRTGGYEAAPKPQQAQPRRLAQRAPIPQDFWDVRHLQWEHVLLNGHKLCMVHVRGVAMYALVDVLMACACRTGAGAIADKLPKHTRRKLWVFAGLRPTWFVDDQGLRMVLVARGFGSTQLTLNLTAQ